MAVPGEDVTSIATCPTGERSYDVTPVICPVEAKSLDMTAVI